LSQDTNTEHQRTRHSQTSKRVGRFDFRSAKFEAVEFDYTDIQ